MTVVTPIVLATCGKEQPFRKASTQSTIAPSLAPSSFDSSSSSSDDVAVSMNAAPKDAESKHRLQLAIGEAQDDSETEDEDGSSFDCGPAFVHHLACMSADPLQRPMVSPGMCVRVWRREMSPTRMEWAEVIRRTIIDGSEWFLCETFLFELFEFSPQLVAEGRDEAVEMYDISCEDIENASLRQQEVARLHSALSEGLLESLPHAPAYEYPGFIIAPSQFHVKCTILGSVTSEKQRDLQDSFQQRLLENLARCPHLPSARRLERPRSNASRKAESRWQVWVDTVKSHFSSRAIPEEHTAVQCEDTHSELLGGEGTISEIPAEHCPELCSECIRMGTWCCGTLHLSSATVCLDAAVALTTQGSVHWLPCEAGVESEIQHCGECLLLQIRPSLFCIPDKDVQLFGSTRHPLEARPLEGR